jgi:hypothetical protein
MEDPTTSGVLAGLIVEGLKEVIRIGQYLKSRGPELLLEEDRLRVALEGDSSLVSILRKSTLDIAPDGLSEDQLLQLNEFLRLPETESIVRQIFAVKLTDGTANSLESVRHELHSLTALHLNLDDQNREELANLLFRALLDGCSKGLDIAIDQGVLAAHEAKSSFRFRVLRDELATVARNLQILLRLSKPDVQTILKFETQYRRQIASRYGTITPPYVDVAHRLPIDDLYVAPSFTKLQQEEPQALRTYEILSSIYRAVVLGNPGSGKSTFAQKLCYDLSNHYSGRLFAGRRLTPILVTLRDYGAAKKATGCSILQFIQRTTNSDHQIEPPQEAFEYLLLNGRALVIFDGLDELLDTSYRQQVTKDVESFCTLFPSIPVLVTSRDVGYEQAPLDKRRFDAFRLTDFDDEQVQEYATKWFAANTDLTDDQQKKETQAFLAESRIVPDLRANPLMLGLMCNIYRGENYIPRNRPDVYRKCAEMLFERWDRGRGIYYSLPFEAHIRPAMTYLAYWIFSSETLQSGATEQQLIAKAVEYLHPNQFEDGEQAAMAARQFVAFCHGRAWVFTDTGTTARGDLLTQEQQPAESVCTSSPTEPSWNTLPPVI